VISTPVDPQTFEDVPDEEREDDSE
jgi:hypothetical protein